MGRHVSSRCAIDGLWSSEAVPALEGSVAERPREGDHTLIECAFDLRVPKGGSEWRLARTPEDKREAELLKDVSWQDVACSSRQWESLRTDLDAAWQQWCQDSQAWLSAAGALGDRVPERALGSEPRLRSGQHRVSAGQSVQERRVRRLVRRLREAQVLQHRGRQVPSELQAALLKSPTGTVDLEDVRMQRYGALLRVAQARLEAILEAKQREALTKWKEDIHTVRGACRWLKREEAVPQLLQTEDGQVLTQPSQALPALKAYWGRIFGCPPHPGADHEGFWSLYCRFLRGPVSPFPTLDPLTAEQIKSAAKACIHKAGGPDGLTPRMIARLPDGALSRLADVLNRCEMEGRFPSSLSHWRVVFIPKKRKGKIATLGDVRPVAIGPTVYRLWGRLRLQALSQGLASLLLPCQGGGLKGQDAETLVASYHLDFPPESWGHGVMLDYAKAFDATDWQLCTEMLRQMALPEPVVRLLEDQWCRHSRWLSFSGAATTPLRGARGLPQGDPWSPGCLALLLSLPAQQVEREVPEAATLLFADDRTVIAQSLGALQRAKDSWTNLETVSRLRTQETKSRRFARTKTALSECEEAGIACDAAAPMLGVSVGCDQRDPSREEVEREEATKHLATRLSFLPLSLRFKAFLASTTLACKASWGAVLSGRCLSSAEKQRFGFAFRLAVKGQGVGPADRSSRPLQRVLVLGHCCNLGLLGVQKTLGALARWTRLSRGLGKDPTRCDLAGSQVGQALVSELRALGWGAVRNEWGAFCSADAAHYWRLEDPLQSQKRAGHFLRTSWRVAQFNGWLAHPSRRDAQVARAVGVQVTPDLVERVRKVSALQDGHGLSVMCGGFSTDARWSPAGPIRDSCRDCLGPQCPAIEHVGWHCSHPK